MTHEEVLRHKQSRIEEFSRIGVFVTQIMHDTLQSIGNVCGTINGLERNENSTKEQYSAAFSEIKTTLDSVYRCLQGVDSYTPRKYYVKEIEVKSFLEDKLVNLYRFYKDVKFTFSGEGFKVYMSNGALLASIAEVTRNSIDEFETLKKNNKNIKSDIHIHFNPYARTITISDTGNGIAAEHIPYIFDPLYSTKVNSIGMGLTKAKEYLEAFGATVAYETNIPSDDYGATFKISFPKFETMKALFIECK